MTVRCGDTLKPCCARHVCGSGNVGLGRVGRSLFNRHGFGQKGGKGSHAFIIFHHTPKPALREPGAYPVLQAKLTCRDTFLHNVAHDAEIDSMVGHNKEVERGLDLNAGACARVQHG